jgi:hypothetical protein
VCGVCGGVGVWGSRPLLTFDIPQTALVATLDTYDFIIMCEVSQTTMSSSRGRRKIHTVISILPQSYAARRRLL